MPHTKRMSDEKFDELRFQLFSQLVMNTFVHEAVEATELAANAYREKFYLPDNNKYNPAMDTTVAKDVAHTMQEKAATISKDLESLWPDNKK